MSFLRIACLVILFLPLSCGDDEPERQRDRSRLTRRTKVVTPPARDAAPDARDSDSASAPDQEEDGIEEYPFKTLTDEQRRGLIKSHVQFAKAQIIAEEDLQEAIVLLEGARDSSPEDARLRIRLSEACFESKNHDCVLSETAEALKLVSENKASGADIEADAHYLAGLAHFYKNNADASRKSFGKSQKIGLRASLVEYLSKIPENPGENSQNQEITCNSEYTMEASILEAISKSKIVRDKTICPLLNEPFVERDTNGVPTETHIVAALSRHKRTQSHAGNLDILGASGNFNLLMVQITRDQPEIIPLDQRRAHGDEILSGLSAKIRRITLGPSRPGLVVETISEGYWKVSEDRTGFSFKRNQLYVVGKKLNQMAALANQVTFEKGDEPVRDCMFGTISQEAVRGGRIWLEDLDLNGVPEICQESTIVTEDPRQWIHKGTSVRRIKASCQSWVASALEKSSSPIPSLEIDEMDEDRAIHQVLEATRVPSQMRNSLHGSLQDQSVIAVRSLELTRSGMRVLAITVTNDSVKALIVSAGDAVSRLDLGRIGSWTEVWGEIDASDPELIAVKVRVRGSDLSGAVERTRLYLISAGPGENPILALDTAIEVESTESSGTCPSLIKTRHTAESREGTRFITFSRRKQTGPGVYALKRIKTERCNLFEALSEDEPEEHAKITENIPFVPIDVCKSSNEELPQERYALGADRRFSKTTLR